MLIEEIPHNPMCGRMIVVQEPYKSGRFEFVDVITEGGEHLVMTIPTYKVIVSNVFKLAEVIR
jgi:hypothetical protein